MWLRSDRSTHECSFFLVAPSSPFDTAFHLIVATVNIADNPRVYTSFYCPLSFPCALC